MSTTYGVATADLTGGRPDNAASHEMRTRVTLASHPAFTRRPVAGHVPVQASPATTIDEGREWPCPKGDFSKLKRRWLPAGAALLFYIALAFLLFWQVWPSPGRRSLGSSADPEQMMWFLGWTQFALSHQDNPLFSDFLDYPHGVNLMWNASTLLPGALLSPVTAWQGPVVAYDLLLTLSLPLSAWCAYLAIGRWVQGPIAAVVGGLLYGFSPYMVAQAQIGRAHV